MIKNLSNNKKIVIYLILLVLLTVLSWGVLAYRQMPLIDILRSPGTLALLFLGGFAPAIAGAIIYRDEEGHSVFYQMFKLPRSRYVILIPLFLVLHFGLHGMKGYERMATPEQMLPFFPILFIIGAVQEIGWVKVVQPMFSKRNGYWKSMVATGLFRALWYLPLMYVPGFPLLPTAYVHFAGALVGVSGMSCAIYQTSGGLWASMLFHGFLLALTPMLQGHQHWTLILYTVIEMVCVYLIIQYRDNKKKREEQRDRIRNA